MKEFGFSQETVEKMRAGEKVEDLTEAEFALVEFVRKAAGDPSSIGPEDIQELRQHGWDNPDIVEAMSVVMTTAFGNTMSIAMRLHEDLQACGSTDYF